MSGLVLSTGDEVLSEVSTAPERADLWAGEAHLHPQTDGGPLRACSWRLETIPW